MAELPGRFCMAPLAIKEWEGDLVVAYPAVFACVDIEHRVFYRPFPDTREYPGMAYFAPVPDRMLVVGEYNAACKRCPRILNIGIPLFLFILLLTT